MNEPWVKVTSAVTGGSTFRTRQVLERVVESILVTLLARYLKRDLDGNGKLDTCCNYAVKDMTLALGCEIPTLWVKADGSTVRFRVQEQMDWLLAEGPTHGWTECAGGAALARAALGFPTVVVWVARDGSTGHIALVVPNKGMDEGIHIAQAGASCFTYGTLAQGFGALEPLHYFTHP